LKFFTHFKVSLNKLYILQKLILEIISCFEVFIIESQYLSGLYIYTFNFIL